MLLSINEAGGRTRGGPVVNYPEIPDSWLSFLAGLLVGGVIVEVCR